MKTPTTTPFRKYIYLVTLSAAALLAACSSGSSSGGSSGLPTGTFTKAFEPTPTGQHGYPFDNSADIKYQTLYLAGEINGSGDIKTLRLMRNTVASDVNCPNTTIKLGHTNVAALTDTFANNVETGKGTLTTVFDNATLTIPAGAADTWFDIPLTTPFHYNGVDNLVVEISHVTACTGDAYVRNVDASSNRRAFSVAPDSTPGVSDLGAAEDTANGPISTKQLLMQFVFSGGDNKVEFIAAPDANNAPLSTNPNFQKVQMLYSASAIDGSGPITGVGLQVQNDVAGLETFTYTMAMGHTSLTDLTTDWNSNANVGSPVTVASSTNYTVPAGVPAGGFIWLPIPDGVFTYNGTDNLVIELTIESASGNIVLSTHPTTGKKSFAYGPAASLAADATTEYVHQVALRFHGSTIDRVIGVGGADVATFPGAVGGRSGQYLYLASELGTSGSITRLACRMTSASSSATDYPNYQVAMSHTDNATLGTDPAANMPTPTVVFSGTYSLPAGLKEGDWIEIPLTTPFDYNGTQNLIIETKSDQGGTTHHCSVLSDAVQYPSRRAAGATRDAASATVWGHLRDVRLWISK